MDPRTPTSRVAALFAAVTVATLIVGSQFGLADGYTTSADAVLAAKRTAPVAQQASAPSPQRARS